jgi:excisionase family DNA binding protein
MRPLKLEDIETLEEYLTVNEFAAAVRVSPRTVWCWVEAGEVDSWRRGSTTRIPRTELLSKSERGG